jgi:thiamine biosynthesis lipoprotein
MMFSANHTIGFIKSRGGFLLLLFCFFSCVPSSEVPEYTWQGQTMGTSYMVKITHTRLDAQELNEIKSKVEEALIEVNRQMSPYDLQSEISRFNNSKDTTNFKVSPQFVDVVQTALEVYRASDEAFDITVAPLVNLWGFGTKGITGEIPSETEIDSILRNVGSNNLQVINHTHIKKKIPDLHLDLSAIAKGYGVDVVANILNASGLANYMVEIGGEVVARGLNAKKEAWQIGIDKPKFNLFPGQELQGILALKDAAVATSGDYRNFYEIAGKQYSHTIDPKTGRPVTHNLASTTIITKRCMHADALATAVMVMGKEKGLKWIENMPDVEAMLIIRHDDDRFETFSTSGFAKYLSRK